MTRTDTRRRPALPLEAGPPPGHAEAVFLQGVFPFVGDGLLAPALLHPDLCYTVPRGHTARLIYFRVGNAADGLIYLSVLVDGQVRRYFPIGPQGAMHVPLAIREEIAGGSEIALHLAAGEGLIGTVVVDVGLTLGEGDSP